MSDNKCMTCVNSAAWRNTSEVTLCSVCVGFKNWVGVDETAYKKEVSATNPKLIKYLPIAVAVSNLSKDTSTKVGAMVIGPDGESGPWGYNGAVRGCSADEDHRWKDRDTRLQYAEHAERNAIYAAARSGFSVKGCSIVVTHFPCVECARAIIQSGITTVVCPTPSGEFLGRWSSSIETAKSMFEECGVKLIEVDHDVGR